MNAEEAIDTSIYFINDDYFSLSNRDEVISVIGRINKSELYKLIRNYFFENEKALNDVGYEIVKKG